MGLSSEDSKTQKPRGESSVEPLAVRIGRGHSDHRRKPQRGLPALGQRRSPGRQTGQHNAGVDGVGPGALGIPAAGDVLLPESSLKTKPPDAGTSRGGLVWVCLRPADET